MPEPENTSLKNRLSPLRFTEMTTLKSTHFFDFRWKKNVELRLVEYTVYISLDTIINMFRV